VVLAGSTSDPPTFLVNEVDNKFEEDINLLILIALASVSPGTTLLF
jgi:hypothetical protein